MISRFANIVFSLVLCQSLIYTPFVFAEESQLSLPSGDLVAPEVKHKGLTEPVKEGQPVKISATVTDNVGVQSVILFYRAKGAAGEYKRIPMTREGQTDVFSAQLKDVHPPGVEYYIQASDLAGNTLLHGYSFSPLGVAVIPASAEELAKTPEPAAGEPPVKEAMTEASESSSSSKYKWLWIGLGVVAVGALAGGGGGGGGGGGPTTGTVVISAPTPQP